MILYIRPIVNLAKRFKKTIIITRTQIKTIIIITVMPS